ncbi:MAG: hypothetical protein H6581_10335 [Bacteroidia bacterium]|nr:hypothetical protein [Bacteroidia bacterium]
MRTIAIFLAFSLTGIFGLQAQLYQPGNLNFSLGTSLLHSTGLNLPVELRGEYGIMKYASAGVYFSWGTALEKEVWFTYANGGWLWADKRVNWFFPGACATLHLWDLAGLQKKFPEVHHTDVYVTGFLGARIGKTTIPQNPLDNFNFFVKRKLKAGLVAGIRYEVKAPFQVYTEVGYGPTGWVMFGLGYTLGLKK